MLQTIYLIRHTTPAVKKGICYGQSDLDVTDGFAEEAAIIRQCIQDAQSSVEDIIGKIYSSPLQRCRKLATHLFPDRVISEAGELKEIHCGQWEMRHWDHIPKAEIDPWMNDFVNVRIPGGESYLDLYGRVIPWFNEVLQRTEAIGNPEVPSIAIFTHGGVIRSILSHITGTPLIDSFKTFSLHYGCTIRLTRLAGTPATQGEGERGASGTFRHEFLSNIQSAEKEQHKPATGSTFTQSDHQSDHL